MARGELINTTVEYYTYHELVQVLFDEGGISASTIAQAIVVTSLSTVTYVLAGYIAPKLAGAFTLAGISHAIGTIIADLTDPRRAAMGNAIKGMQPYQDLRIIARSYNNYSGSGNSWWISTEYEAQAVG